MRDKGNRKMIEALYLITDTKYPKSQEMLIDYLANDWSIDSKQYFGQGMTEYVIKKQEGENK